MKQKEVFENNEPMMSQREVEKKYSELMNDVATKDYYKIDLTNRVNVYSCKCGYRFKTKDVDPGVTPMFKDCLSCKTELAKSSFYNDIAPELQPLAEWYRPTLKQCLKMRKKDPATLEHVFSGGLDFRLIIQ